MACLIVLVGACSDSSDLTEQPFPAPTGAAAVGVVEFHWKDETRPNPFTALEDDSRRVPVRIWYPAESVSGAEPALYIFDLEEFRNVDWIESGLRLRTRAVLEAPPALQGAPFPVLLYNHGGGYPRFIGSALGEELASHGYVVVSVGHDGFNHGDRSPDGATLDDGTLRSPQPTGDFQADIVADLEFHDAVHFPLWIADCRYVLDRLVEMNSAEDGFLAGRLQLERVGAYGWSFGGAAAVQLLASEPRVRAAVNFDGQLFGDADRRGAQGAFLVLRSSQIYEPPQSDDREEAERNAAVLAELLATIESRFQALLDNSSGRGEIWRIDETKHVFFSDLLHLSVGKPEIYAGRVDTGELEPARGHELMATTLREFFGRELLGFESDFLEDPSAIFSEIEVVARNTK